MQDVALAECPHPKPTCGSVLCGPKQVFPKRVAAVARPRAAASAYGASTASKRSAKGGTAETGMKSGRIRGGIKEEVGQNGRKRY